MSLDPNRHDPARNDLLAQIKEGMTVVDSAGDDVGKVSFVQMADVNDPDENTGARDGDVGLLDLTGDDDNDKSDGLLDVLDIETGPGVTDRMVRRGFVKIDASGLFSGDKYVVADDISVVEADTVRLSIPKDSIQHPG